MLDYLAHIFTRIANNPRDNQPFKALFFFFFSNTPRCTCKSVSTCSGSLNSLSLESPPRRNAGQRCEEETRGWRWSIYYMLYMSPVTVLLPPICPCVPAQIERAVSTCRVTGDIPALHICVLLIIIFLSNHTVSLCCTKG